MGRARGRGRMGNGIKELIIRVDSVHFKENNQFMSLRFQLLYTYTQSLLIQAGVTYPSEMFTIAYELNLAHELNLVHELNLAHEL